MTQGNLSDYLRRKVDSIWRAIHHHDCIISLGEGRLDPERYKYLLLQDYLYLEDYGKALTLTAIKSKQDEIRDKLLHSVTTTLEEEKDFIRSEISRQGIDNSSLIQAIKSPTIQAYTDFLVRTASQESFSEGIAVFLVCNWNFYEIGQHLARYTCSVDSLSIRWKERYTSPSLLGIVNWYKDILDNCFSNPSPKDINRVEKAFITASYYEYRFWNAVQSLEQWEIFDESIGQINT